MVAIILAICAVPLMCVGIGLLVGTVAFGFAAAAIYRADATEETSTYKNAQIALFLSSFELLVGLIFLMVLIATSF